MSTVELGREPASDPGRSGRPAPQYRRLDALRGVFRHQLRRTRPVWVSSLLASLAGPTLFLFAIGSGLGSQIDDADLAELGVTDYIDYIGPGLLIVAAMQIAATEGMWPTMGLLKWEGVYKAIMATPITSAELGIAHVLWIAFRAMVVSVCFLVVLAVAGTVRSWTAVGVVAVAALVGVVHAGPLVAFTARMTTDHLYPLINRIVVFPLFLFSGAFFPVEDMPAGAAAVARVMPTWHGVELARHLAVGRLGRADWGHLAYLVALAILGMYAAQRQFRKHLGQ